MSRLKEIVRDIRKEKLDNFVYALILRLGQPDRQSVDKVHTLIYGDQNKYVEIQVTLNESASIVLFDKSTANERWMDRAVIPFDVLTAEKTTRELIDLKNNNIMDIDKLYCLTKFFQTRNRKKIMQMLGKFLVNAVHSDNREKLGKVKRLAFEIAYNHGVSKNDLEDLWTRVNKNLDAAKILI